jgi:O-methyltransferase
MEIPGQGLVGGEWDLRGGEDAYLGGVELAGRRVIEIGPASGFLTFFMESRGADVVGVELAPEAAWDVVPHAGLDAEWLRTEWREHLEMVRNGFWFAHERFGSNARIHYGSAYELPAALGHFDLAIMGSVLLHLRDPLRAVEQCARVADCVVVSDIHTPELDGAPVARLEPTPGDSDNWHTWWHISPQLLVRFLGVLGFEQSTTTHHEQRHVGPDGRAFPMRLFTIVATR